MNSQGMCSGYTATSKLSNKPSPVPVEIRKLSEFFTIHSLYISDNMPVGLLCVLGESGLDGGSLASQLLLCQAGLSGLLPELSLSGVGRGEYRTRIKKHGSPLPHWLVIVKVTQLHPTLRKPMDYTVHGILQPEYCSG